MKMTFRRDDGSSDPEGNKVPTNPNAAARSTGQAVQLDRLLIACGLGVNGDASPLAVSSVEYDSRAVEPGALFVAVRGFVTDGHGYIADAAARGAVAALVEEKTGADGIKEVVVPDTRRALGLVSHELYGRPSEHLSVHGVTGTNGKTTTTYLIDSILRAAGRRTGVIGTLGYRIAGSSVPSERTSPESLDVARLLVKMLEAGTEAVSMEVSSHALALDRAVGMKFDTATFTNLSRDHLDFHRTLDEYAAAKRRLFELLEGDAWKPGATAVVNIEDNFGRELSEHLAASERVGLITYGMSIGDVRATEVSATASGTIGRFSTPDGPVSVRLSLIAGFNVLNALAATAVAVSQGIPTDAIEHGLASVGRVEGRLEPVNAGQRFAIVVDYAHTPDALSKVLSALDDIAEGRIITVFGCGGDRDRGKRPIMGAIAMRQSDVVVVTSDNPRTESPGAIIKEIVAGTSAGGRAQSIDVIEDRASAIRHAVSLARDGDIVLIAGKGHEDYQIVGKAKLHFDDREIAEAAVAEALSNGRADGDGGLD